MPTTYGAGLSSGTGTDIFVPRPHQIQAGEAILAARKAGRPGFLLGDMTGLGKTLATWLALADMPETEILIVCPKGAVAQWRRTIHLSGSPPRDVLRGRHLTSCPTWDACSVMPRDGQPLISPASET